MRLRSLNLTALVLFLAAFARAEDKPANPAVVPVPREDAWWKERHESFNARAAKGDVDLLFIGDSITQGWEGGGKDVWEKSYTPRKAMNLGIGGDRTQHVLWRLDNGNIEGLTPKAAVIMIGTNNSGDDSAENIAAGVEAIVKKLRDKLPKTKILLLAIFPRSEKPDATRAKLEATNKILSKLGDGKNVYYLDIGPKFLEPDGTISKEIMPDFLHLTPKGYQIWADGVEPALKTLLGEK